VLSDKKFQSTPAHERATFPNPVLVSLTTFQSTPAHERATPSAQATVQPACSFQSTPAHERATKPKQPPILHKWFQSTPAHERATWSDLDGVDPYEVSIHARSRAGDLDTLSTEILCNGFNPRPLTSGRRADGRLSNSQIIGFNPRPLTSGRLSTTRTTGPTKTFQSTPAHERATMVRFGRRRSVRGFNPRPLTSGRRAILWLPFRQV